jgi:uncharacterized protein YjiS (DUF1127 family)
MASMEIFAQIRRSPKATPAAWFLSLARLLKRRRQARGGKASLNSFNDRMLADIGLRRDRPAPDVRHGDLLGWRGEDRARIGRL